MEIKKITIHGGTVNFATSNNGNPQTSEETAQRTTFTERTSNADHVSSRDVHIVNKNSPEEFDPVIDTPRCFKTNEIDLAAE